MDTGQYEAKPNCRSLEPGTPSPLLQSFPPENFFCMVPRLPVICPTIPLLKGHTTHLHIPHLHIPPPVCEGFLASEAIYQKKVDGCYHQLAAPIHGYPAYEHSTRKWLLFFNPNASTPPLGHWIIADNLTAHVRSMAKGNGTTGPTAIAAGGWYSWYNNTYIVEKAMHFAATSGVMRVW